MTRKHPGTFENGFTLFELSMVLIIIALIIGAVFVGQAMIRTAQINSVISDIARYTQAFTDFRDKYHELPGDFSNAEALWGSDASCPNTPYTATAHTATCNGNGSGSIGNILVDGGATEYELFRAWQQLADAGMINGSFNGISGTGSAENSLLGINVPASLISGAGYTIFYVPPGYSDYNNWPALYNHRIEFGNAVSGFWTYHPILTPAEAMSIDSKVDDGLPGYGHVMTYTPNINPNCVTSFTQAVALYNTADSGIDCMLMFITGF